MKQYVTRLAQALPRRPMSGILPIRLPFSLDAASITELNNWATPVSELGKTLEIAFYLIIRCQYYKQCVTRLAQVRFRLGG
jgi:hypothetical protein